ncbi:GGDEF domain-containing protein [Pseudanabaena sp. lw0831]|uniref:GGDEF domain-containing protein n=1 Tax=Pseudanabaena sp. lw0831 TaxID=1357935 RepID=UPI0019168294|nr:GGDEF domain-containing protein [Pseudanabaena sp. lw0831]
MFTNLVNFDIQTMTFMLGIDATLQVLILGFLSLLVNQYRGIKTYAIGRAFTTTGFLISLSKGFPLSFTLVLAGIFLLVGTSISCVGVSQFTDKKIKLHYLFIINLLFLGVQLYFLIFKDVFVFKTINQTVFQIIIYTISTYCLLTTPHKSFIGSSRFMASVTIALSMSLVARIVGLVRNPPEQLFASNDINAYTLVVAFLFTFLLTTGFIMMVCQRLYYDLKVAANTDVLTHLLNRRAMMHQLEIAMNQFYRSDRTFAIILIDVDFFKRVNDVYGHDGGDMVLIHLAQILQTKMRKADSASRWGGEEFLILLPDTTLDQAHELAERLRSYVETNPTPSNIQITISLGIAVIRQHGNSVESLITAADHALYAAKKNGRNLVAIAN